MVTQPLKVCGRRFECRSAYFRRRRRGREMRWAGVRTADWRNAGRLHYHSVLLRLSGRASPLLGAASATDEKPKLCYLSDCLPACWLRD